LGLSVRRLPLADDAASIDEAESVKIVRCAIDQGVNYIDLGYPYDMGRQESLLRVTSRALQDGYQHKVKIATSLPSLLVSSPRDFDYYLNGQLECLGMERVDFFLLGCLNRETWPKLREMSVLGWVEKAVASGRIGYLGFSCHDHFQVLRGILEDYDRWALAQFKYSYMDVDCQPGVGGLEYAASKGLAVVAAEPLRGGWLTKEPPEPVARVWASALKKRALAEWGLRWVWDHSEVATAIVDMIAIEQVMQNAALADQAEANSLTVPEEVLISQVREAYRKLRPIPCTACRGCIPCAQGIDVPRIFELYNDAIMYGDIKTARSIYLAEKHHIDGCSDFGDCVCGRDIDIPGWLEKARQLFA
jgi:predicted aldo/keto reductase-like oxidoreductase